MSRMKSPAQLSSSQPHRPGLRHLQWPHALSGEVRHLRESQKIHQPLQRVERSRPGTAPTPIRFKRRDGGSDFRFVTSEFADQRYQACAWWDWRGVVCIRRGIRLLNQLYSRLPAAEFSPLKLRAVRSEMIRAGWARSYINKQILRIRRMFKWAVEEELVPAEIWNGLRAMAELRRGQSEARESEPVKPVAAAMVEAVLPLVSAQVRDMIKLQRLTGMRPEEVCQLRWAELETAEAVWTYRPTAHKTAHHGHVRTIYLGPQAQEILERWLRPPAEREVYLFSPAEAGGGGGGFDKDPKKWREKSRKSWGLFPNTAPGFPPSRCQKRRFLSLFRSKTHAIHITSNKRPSAAWRSLHRRRIPAGHPPRVRSGIRLADRVG